MPNEFETLHPRARKGTEGAGHFVDVVGKIQALGGEWDKPRNVWILPAAQRPALDALLNTVGFDAVNVPEGSRPATDEDRAHFKVPPAWTDVFVNDAPGAKRLVVGKDEAGRQQSIYSAEHTAEQAAAKFSRISRLHEHMPAVDARLAAEAGSDDTAAAMMLVRKMGLRPGSNRDTRAALKAYGASTLERRHVQVKGSTVRLAFTGKKGVAIDLEVEDPELAKMLSRRLKGKTGDTRLFQTNENLMRRWVEQTAPGFKPKDFRTYLGTSEAQAMVKELPAPTSHKEAVSSRNAVGAYISQLLGNTRTIALASYIDPSVFRTWEEWLDDLRANAAPKGATA